MKDLKIFTENIEDVAREQIDLLLEQEAFKDCKIRIMPDVHAGAGCVIGFTGNLGDKVIPNIVGVDIGCGMLTVELGKVDIDLKKLDQVIRQFVPSGFNVHEERKVKFDKLQELKCYRELRDTKRLERSIGTLGGGNHFIEIDVDDKGNKYLIIHTGSRNLGKQVAEYYQNLAVELCSGKEKMMEEQQEIIATYKEQGRKDEIQLALADLRQKYAEMMPSLPKDLCYLTGQYREDYLHDMKICQEYASDNRQQIAISILNNYFDDNFMISGVVNHNKGIVLSGKTLRSEWFETIHNYISFEDNIVRKGAISAKKDEIVLIPINMRDGCIIARGKGNDDWNQSAPHGAGRIMSRMEARRKLNLKDFEETMEGIYTTSVSESTIDEAPMTYKPMQEIIDNIQDTVEIIKIIKPIYNFKASE